MKNIFLSYSLLVLFMFSCQGSGVLRIKGTIDVENGSNLYHIVADANNQPKVLDTLASQRR
jgi:hypothetical protein